jgi:hypothetical protein
VSHGIDLSALSHAEKDDLILSLVGQLEAALARIGELERRLILLDVLEEGENHRDIEILDLKQAGALAQSARGERHQKLEAVGVGITGVDAGSALAW